MFVFIRLNLYKHLTFFFNLATQNLSYDCIKFLRKQLVVRTFELYIFKFLQTKFSNFYFIIYLRRICICINYIGECILWVTRKRPESFNNGAVERG